MIKIQRNALLLAMCIATILTGSLMYYLNLKSLNVAPLVKVIVATTNIPADSVINDKELEEVSIPLKFILSDALVEKSQIVGKIAKVDIIAGEQIVRGRVQLEKKREGMAANLPLGYRAITIKVDPVSGVNHQIKTGNYVDILLYYKPQQDQSNPQSAQTGVVNTVFQQVEVIDTSGEQGSGEWYVTLCLKPEAAEKIFMADVTGKIRFTLRPADDNQNLVLPGASYNSFK